jgi:hypothetical protein
MVVQDIVTRLREEVMWVQHKTNTQIVPDPLCQEAADEIERLRKAGDALTEWTQYNHRSDRCTGKFASKCVCGLDEHVKAWQEARRD